MHHHTHFFLGFEMDAIFRPAEPVGRALMRSPGTQNMLQQDRAGGYEAPGAGARVGRNSRLRLQPRSEASRLKSGRLVG